MKAMLAVAVFAYACATALFPASTTVAESKPRAVAHENRIPVGNAELYSREIGQGTAIIVLHGGPDFDHSYFCLSWTASQIPTGLSITTSEAVAGPPMA